LQCKIIIYTSNDFYRQIFFSMRTVLIVILLFFGLAGCKNTMEVESAIEFPVNISTFQQYMLDEINLARTNPAAYAELRLKDEMVNSGDNGSYIYLKSLTPVSSLSFSNVLNCSASNYALFLAQKDLMGHNENGTPLKRAIIEGFAGTSVGENIAASSAELYNATLEPRIAAIGFVRIMIIDAGVSDLGHRLTMLNSKYKIVGIGYSRIATSTFINYTVQNFGNL
jgi:hypothetical protein